MYKVAVSCSALIHHPFALNEGGTVESRIFGNTGVIEARSMISHIDHLVLTVDNLQLTADFYARVLGMERVTFGEGRVALRFGGQKINLHQAGAEFEPKAMRPVAGSGDLCFITPLPRAQVCRHIWSENVEIIEGPVRRNGAMGPILSIYLRDPDGSLVEIANQLEHHT